MKSGLFIVLDGNDGSGKATQSKLLAAHFASEGTPAHKVDFPAYDTNLFGALIGECLAGKHGDFLHMDPKIASVLYSADRQESAPAIRSALTRGEIVIADRFSSSNQIHQGGKIEDEAERIEFLLWLDRMEHEVLQVPRPDAIIYLKVPVEISLQLLSEKRAAKNQHLGDVSLDMVEEDRRYLERSHATANWLAHTQPNWHVIECTREDAMCSIEDIQSEIQTVVVGL